MVDLTLHTDTQTLYASYVLNGPYEAGVGERARVRLDLSRGDLTVSGNYTVAGSESYDRITVAEGATLTVPDGSVLVGRQLNVNGTLDNDGTVKIIDSVETLLNYDEYSGNYQTTEMLDGTLRYEENIPDDAAVDSLVVGVEPDNELQSDNIVGVWGLIDNVRDTRPAALTTERVDLSVRVLARFDDYETISDVRNALEV